MEPQREGAEERWWERRLSSSQAALVWAASALLGWSATLGLFWSLAQLF